MEYEELTPERRLLLGHAVHRAKSPDQIPGVNACNFTVGECLGEDVQRDAVIGVVEYGDEYDAIGNVEIGVARRKALFSKMTGTGRVVRQSSKVCHSGR